MPQQWLRTAGEVTVRPHPRREAVTQMLPGRSPDSRYIGRENIDSTTDSRLPAESSTVTSCESPSRLQWRYRSGFSPLSHTDPDDRKTNIEDSEEPHVLNWSTETNCAKEKCQSTRVEISTCFLFTVRASGVCELAFPAS